MHESAPGLTEVVEALRRADRVALACHVNPDGDALGSLLALSEGLRALGKQTFPSWGSEPASLPLPYAFLPAADTLLQPGDVPETSVFVALDCGAAHRLGALEDKARRAPVTVNIDHHPGNEGFGDVNMVVTDASSTAELVAAVLDKLGVPLEGGIATNLYVGVVTDTGRFSYANARPDTLRLAADLLATGVDAPRIAQEIYESSPFTFLKLVGRVLDRAELFPEERFVYSWITQRDLAETGVPLDETDKLVDMIRSIRDADVAALFKEQTDGRFRVSLRSKGPAIGHLARARGGGGHDLAAGFTADDVEQTAAALRAELVG